MDWLKLCRVQLEATINRVNKPDCSLWSPFTGEKRTMTYFNLTKRSSCHGLGVNGWLCIRSGEVWSGVIPALVIVVFNVEAGELGEADSQGAASIVDVLPIQ